MILSSVLATAAIASDGLDSVPLWIGIIVAILGTSSATAFVTQWFERRHRQAQTQKTGAEADLVDAQATDVLVQAGKTAVEILTAELNRALERIEALETVAVQKDARILQLEEREAVKDARIAHLENQVADLRAHIIVLEEDADRDDTD